MFYDKFKYLCEEAGISVNKAATDLGLSNATPTTWKKRCLTPKGETLSKIADYFKVPLDFVLERPPFDFWDAINQDRKNFLDSLGMHPDTLRIIWGIDINNPDLASGKLFISLLSICVDKAMPKEDSGWLIIPRAGAPGMGESLTTVKSEPHITDEDLIHVLWGDDIRMGTADLAKVKRYASFIQWEKNAE